jgi:hypothetical protein
MRPSKVSTDLERMFPTMGPVGTREVVNSFAQAENLDEQLLCIDKLTHNGSALDHAYTGDMWLDIAWNAEGDYDFRVNAFNQAIAAWEKSLKIHSVGSHLMNNSSSRASRMLANIGLYRSLIFDGIMPAAEVVQAAYTRTLEIGVEQNRSMEKITSHSDRNKRNIEAVQELAGAISQTSILLLFQRFSMKIGTENWLALPSLVSQEFGNQSHGTFYRKNWNLSVFGRLSTDESPELTYKIQVKTNKNDNESRQYEDGITVIYAREDAKVTESARTLRYNTIIDDCVAEQDQIDPDFFSKTLDMRTERLLDVID